MKKETTVYIFFGTTAELIKLIPVIRELQKRRIKYKIVLSGQTDVNFEEFEKLIGKQKVYYSFKSKLIKSSPLHFLLWSIRTTSSAIFWSIREFAPKNKKEVLFLVHGDTMTTLIGGVAAKIGGVKLAHIEAGVRSYNFFEPFPEEICRYLISFLADINFCPNNWACGNMKNRKGIKIDTKWNTMVETLSLALKTKTSSKLLKFLEKKKYLILFLHRQEHIFIRKNDTKKIIDLILNKITENNYYCLFIVPGVTKIYLSHSGLFNKIYHNKNIKVVSRLPFSEFAHVMNGSEFIVSDGGANQPESHFLGKPCLLLRKVTEQTEGIGENVVLSREDPNVISDFFDIYEKYKYPPKKVMIWPSKIIVDTLINNRR
jgi:UDP-N-acetylglucosamine 2-epimerase (non-hydrolysing)